MKDPTLKVGICRSRHVSLLTAYPERRVLTFVQAGVIKDLVLLACVGVRPVLVHGGGPEINIWLNKLGIKAEFKNGLRVTDGKFVTLPAKLMLAMCSCVIVYQICSLLSFHM
jgi:acetylglutamate kinase